MSHAAGYVVCALVAMLCACSCSADESASGPAPNMRATPAAHDMPPQPPDRTPAATPATDASDHVAPAVDALGDDWQPVLDATAVGREAWFTELWASDQQVLYVAGNRGVTRRKPDGTVDTFAVGTDAVMGIWGRSDTEVYAVGNHGAIARYDGTRWLLEREPGPKVPRSAQLLNAVGHFLGDQTVIAFGPMLAVKRESDGHWTPLHGTQDLQVRANRGIGDPIISPCEGVGEQHWQADRAGKVWIECNDRRSYWMTGDRAELHGLVPRSCKTPFWHTFFHQELYVACEGALYRNRGNDWARLSVAKGVRDLREIKANDHCLFVAGKRNVFRQCISP